MASPYTIRGGSYTIRGGSYTIRGGPYTIRGGPYTVRGEPVEPRHRRVAFGDMNVPSTSSGRTDQIYLLSKLKRQVIKGFLAHPEVFQSPEHNAELFRDLASLYLYGLMGKRD